MLEKNINYLRSCYLIASLLGPCIQYITLNNRYQIEICLKNGSFKKATTLLNKQFFLLFKTVVDIVGLDFPAFPLRFRVVYLLLSYNYTFRLNISTHARDRMAINTITDLYPGCGWLEREVWDLFGVYFQGNRDLRRILTDYGFSGYPLRKDFPLTGFHEVMFDDRKQQVIYQPVSLAQEYRDFTHQNPWLTKTK